MKDDADFKMLDAILAALEEKIPDQSEQTRVVIGALVAYDMTLMMDRITVLAQAYEAAQRIIAGKQDAATQ